MPFELLGYYNFQFLVLFLILSFAAHTPMCDLLVTFREKLSEGSTRFKNMRVRYVEDNPASFHALENAGLNKCDSVVLTGLDKLDTDTADAQVQCQHGIDLQS